MSALHKYTAIAILPLLVAACSSSTQAPEEWFTKENIGTAVGTVGGAWIGSNIGKGKGQIVGAVGGALLGGALGKSIGASLDKADMSYYDQTSQYTLENSRTGAAGTWNNPDTGNSGTITPTRTFQTAAGVHCREYTQSITVDGRTERAYGTACRQPDGTWKIVQ